MNYGKERAEFEQGTLIEWECAGTSELARPAPSRVRFGAQSSRTESSQLRTRPSTFARSSNFPFSAQIYLLFWVWYCTIYKYTKVERWNLIKGPPGKKRVREGTRESIDGPSLSILECMVGWQPGYHVDTPSILYTVWVGIIPTIAERLLACHVHSEDPVKCKVKRGRCRA